MSSAPTARWVKAPSSPELAPTDVDPGAAHRPVSGAAGTAVAGRGEQLSDRRYPQSRAAGSSPRFFDHEPHCRWATAGPQCLRAADAPSGDEPLDDGVGRVAAFPLHAGVVARASERKKLERQYRYVSGPAIAKKRLSLTPNADVRFKIDRKSSGFAAFCLQCVDTSHLTKLLRYLCEISLVGQQPKKETSPHCGPVGKARRC